MSRSSKKLKNFDQYLWRKTYLSFKIFTLLNYDRFSFSRSSVIPNNPYLKHIYLYKGNSWLKKQLNPWVIGYKFGEFSWNKVPAQFKSKRLKKK